MSKYVIDDSTLSSIADAIRAKTGGSDPIAVTDMATQIGSITGGGSSGEVILEKQSVQTTYNSTFSMYTDFVAAPNPIVADETYKIIWDGTEYECTAVGLAGTSFESMGGVAVIGNTDMLAGGNNGVPFVIVYFATETSFRFMVVPAYDTAPATHTVAIYKETSGGGTIEGVCYVTFKNWDGTDLVTKPVFIGDHCTDPVDIDQINEPTRESTNTQVFTRNGWSLTSGGEADPDALKNVTEDRTVYAAYTASTRYYTVRFFDGDTLLHTVYAEYGTVPNYEPEKEGEIFDRWEPALVPVVADADYYAVWAEIQTYGVEWDYSKTNSKLTRIEASAGFSAPAPATSLDAVGSSPFDNIMPWAGMKRYNIINGAVSYSEDDEGFSMTDYDTMVYIPPFYYKAEKDEANTKWRWSICPVAKEGYALHPGSGRYISRYHTSGSSSAVYSKSGVTALNYITRSEFRTYSHKKGNNWWMLDIATWSAVQLLFLVEFANFNSQNLLSRGSARTHNTDGAAYHTCYKSNENQYRWIHNFNGGYYVLIDGFVASGNSCYLGTDNSKFADTTSGLTEAGVTLPTGAVIAGFGYSEAFPWAFLPDTATGTTTLYYVTDYVYSKTDSGNYTLISGNPGTSDNGGLFYFGASSNASYKYSDRGSRLIYIP